MTVPRLIIITDLDGSLLDQETYSYDASLPAIEKLKSLDIPLILCSSKTRSEISLLWQELGLMDPFIAESGGAICLPPGYFPFPLQGVKPKGSFEVLELGTDVLKLHQALMETAQQFQVKIKSLSMLSPDEISALTGLTGNAASLALEREYDEPFLVEEEDGQQLFTDLRMKGFSLTRGDRFFHLTGNHDKGKAAKILLNLYRRTSPEILTVGLGNSANDLSLFCSVDRPVLVRNPDGSWDSEVLRTIPGIERTQGIGPYGWREAVEKILAEAIPDPY